MAEASGRIKIIKSDEDFEKELREAGDRLVVADFFSDEYVHAVWCYAHFVNIIVSIRTLVDLDYS